jgi:hypothetical protein
MKLFTRVLFLLACVAAPLLAADTAEIKQRWIANKQYFYTMQTAQQSTINLGQQKMEQSVTMTMEMNIAVRLHEDGKRKRLTINYDRVAMDMSMNGQKMGYDSAKPDAGTDPMGMGKSLGGMVGKELKVLTNEKDEIVEIENYDEYIKQISGGGMDMAKMFSREQLLQTMKQGFLQAFPTTPVTAGQSWPFVNKITLPQVGTVSVKGNYTFKGNVDHGGVPCAEIQTDGTITMDVGGAGGGPMAALGMKINNATLQGPIWFDLALGAARDAQLVQEITISMKNPVDPAGAIDVPMKQTITNKLTKLVDLK